METIFDLLIRRMVRYQPKRIISTDSKDA